MEEIVHITPLGWEVSRAVKPIEYIHPKRVHLIFCPDSKLVVKFVGRVKSDLKSHGVEVNEVPISVRPGTKITNKFERYLHLISRLVVEEHDKGNRIYLNMSAAGKLAASACLMVGMYHWDEITSVFYARPERYAVEESNPSKIFKDHGLSVGMAGIDYLPIFKIERPKSGSLHILAALYEQGPLPFIELLKVLREHHTKMRSRGAKPLETPFADVDLAGLDKPARRRAAKDDLAKWITKMRRYALDDLLERKYIDLKPSHEGPKKLVDLTQHGRYAALMSGFVTDFPR